MRKNIKSIIIAIVLTFFLQFTLISLTHNHYLDLNQNYDCSACIFSLTLQTFLFIVVFAFNSVLSFLVIYNSIKHQDFKFSACLTFIKDRAPPI